MKDRILKYDVIFEEQSEGGYAVTVPALPGCISEGDTFEEAKENIAEAITEANSNIFVGQIGVQNPILQ